jgi:hypothetical protein
VKDNPGHLLRTSYKYPNDPEVVVRLLDDSSCCRRMRMNTGKEGRKSILMIFEICSSLVAVHRVG